MFIISYFFEPYSEDDFTYENEEQVVQGGESETESDRDSRQATVELNEIPEKLTQKFRKLTEEWCSLIHSPKFRKFK